MFICVPTAWGQNTHVRRAVLEYADDEVEIEAVNANGRDLGSVEIGDRFSQTDSIRTHRTTAEFRLEPNGSILKLSENTTFRLDAFQGRIFRKTTRLTLYTGKLHLIAAASSGTNYRIQTPIVVLGVRGTELIIDVSVGRKEVILVLHGKVEVLNKITQKRIMISAGEFVDAMDEDFEPRKLDEWDEGRAALKETLEKLDFDYLDQEEVPEDDDYESDIDYFKDWDDGDIDDDFLLKYAWDDEYAEQDYFEEADLLVDDDDDDDAVVDGDDDDDAVVDDDDDNGDD
jgi:hypothetical protein